MIITNVSYVSLRNVVTSVHCALVDTGRKLNVHKTFRRRPGRLLNVLCTFNLRHMSTGADEFRGIGIRNPNKLIITQINVNCILT